MRDEKTPIRTTGKDVKDEENEKVEAEADRETRREDAVTEIEIETIAMIDDDENVMTTTQRVIVIIGRNIKM